MWRVKWAFQELVGRDRHDRLGEVLEDPELYTKALLLKLLPGLYRAPIPFQLKAGGAFRVQDFMTLFIFREIFLDQCYDVPIEAEEELVIIDVGANVGLFTLRAKQLWPRSQIYCYEPYPPNHETLSATVAESRLSGVETYREGVGGQARQAVLYIHPRNIGGHSILDASGSGRRVTIDLVDLRQVLARVPRGRCDLLKLDCEGAEHEIISSIDADLASRIPRILYEDTPGLDSQRLTDHLAQQGYKVAPHRGLFLATRPLAKNGEIAR